MSDIQGIIDYAMYHDRHRRTPDGWKFVERVYEVKYVDTAPLSGAAPQAALSDRGRGAFFGSAQRMSSGFPWLRRPCARLRSAVCASAYIWSRSG
jgi:hypothetical protein